MPHYTYRRRHGAPKHSRLARQPGKAERGWGQAPRGGIGTNFTPARQSEGETGHSPVNGVGSAVLMSQPSEAEAKMTFKAIETTDTVTTCDCCGKHGLKKTVVLAWNGDPWDRYHYGVDCAAAALGTKATQTVRQRPIQQLNAAAERANKIERVKAAAQKEAEMCGIPHTVRETRTGFPIDEGMPADGDKTALFTAYPSI